MKSSLEIGTLKCLVLDRKLSQSAYRQSLHFTRCRSKIASRTVFLKLLGRLIILPRIRRDSKYLLGRAAPSHRLNRRLMQIIERQPALSAPISNHIRRYERLPRRLAEGVCAFLEQQEIYAVHAEMLMATIDNMPSGSRRRHKGSTWSGGL